MNVGSFSNTEVADFRRRFFEEGSDFQESIASFPRCESKARASARDEEEVMMSVCTSWNIQMFLATVIRFAIGCRPRHQSFKSLQESDRYPTGQNRPSSHLQPLGKSERDDQHFPQNRMRTTALSYSQRNSPIVRKLSFPEE
jgi:hypothetical protein